MGINRDNAYYEKRLRKEGRTDLLSKVNSGEISMYRATVLAEYRKKKPRDNAEALSRRWYRLNKIERMKFVVDHAAEILQIIRPMLNKSAEKKESE